MSGLPGKRPHEDVGGGGGGAGSNSSGSSKYPHVDSPVGYPTIGPKLPSSAASTDYVHHHTNPHSHPQPMDHTPSPDPRVLPKVPRSESTDKRPALFPPYPRLSSSTNDYPHPDHTVPAFGEDNKLESRENIYNRDPKGENREPGRENRGEEGKDMKLEREPYQSDHKSENAKLDKEGFGSGGSHSHLKESKEHHRIKRFADTPSVNAEMWNASRSNMHGPVEREVGKDVLSEQRNPPTEVHEAVGENKVDFKGEDRLKEKDRKRKEFKHRDWGERDRDRSDHRINLQISSGAGGEGKESLKEEREGEKWEREKKDIAAKDKEKSKEREKDHPIKRETSIGADKDGLQSEKESVDAVGKPSEVESVGTDSKRLRDHDSWKTNDKETKERKKERDADLEGERPEKRSRFNDKESDDGCPDAEAGSERDVFNHGVQQRKRMLRPRGSPQASNRDQRVSSRTQENEGSQGKSDVVTYRVGECMQELLKLWNEYEATQDKSGESSQNGPTLEIRIPAEHVSATNRQVRGGQLWGTDVYTNDSDLVAVLMHTGYCRPTASAPPSAVQELRATIRVLPPRDCYISTLRNNVRSRAWGAGISCSYRVELCCILKRGGGTIELEPCLTQTSTVEPTLAPVTVERTMTTRAAASNALRQQRFVREVTIQYNLCNEPWIKYSISVVADKGLKKALYTSARLKKGEVLYLETHTRRYELCFMGEKTVKSQTHDSEQNHGSIHTTNGDRGGGGGGGSDGVDTICIDVFRWSRCKRPLPQKVMQSLGIPLPLEHVEVLEENLDWEDIQWSQTGVYLAGKEYLLARAHFISP